MSPAAAPAGGSLSDRPRDDPGRSLVHARRGLGGAQEAPTIPAAAAARHIGERGKVCGQVVSVRYAAAARGRPTFLSFERPYPRQPFTAVVWGSDREKFPTPPEIAFGNRKVCVTGTIGEFRGRPQIVVESPEAIALVEEREVEPSSTNPLSGRPERARRPRGPARGADRSRRGSDPEDWLDELIDYVALHDPTFPARIEGATEDDIAWLEQAAGCTLPREYRAYLSRLGRSNGGLLDGAGLMLELGELLEDYREDTEGRLRLGEGLTIGYHRGTYRRVALVPARPERALRVMLLAGDHFRVLEADGLRSLLFREGFRRFELEALPHRADYAVPDPRPAQADVARLATSLGLAARPHVDAVAWLGAGAGAAILYHQPPGQGGRLDVGARTSEALARITGALAASHSLSVRPVA